jgi:precorrin-8X/cobalt-precorrin-8 methylmutase
MAMFDQFVFVDWSANSSPKTGKDSIWIADAIRGAEINVSNVATRHEATDYVRRLLTEAVAENRRVLVGFDFAYSYPLSVLRHLADRQGPRDFSSLWEVLHERIRDHQDNTNNRYAFAAWANEHWFEHHYFWGFPSAAQATTWLRGTKAETHLTELRLAESQMRGTQPTRKLAYVGAVGSQALLGMRRLHALRTDPALATVSCVWPMETGFSLPETAEGEPLIVHAEIYPTPVPAIARQAGITMPSTIANMVNDAQQVWACVALARYENNSGALAARFHQPTTLTHTQLEQAQTEGWILWA